ncbi:MAG: hypothetical protein ACPKNR_02345 [Pleomorphochaeta sp.]
MKKIKICFLIILLLVSSNSIFATDSVFSFEDDVKTQVVRTTSYMPTSSHRLAMGGAGLGLGGFYDSYLYNPANISKDGFKLEVPSLTITLNNVNSLINPVSGGDNIFETIERLDYDQSAELDLANLFISSIPIGASQVITLDTNVGFKTRMIGLDFAVQEKLHSYKNDVNDSTISLISETNIAATMAIGFNLTLIKNVLSIDFGASGAFKFRAYSALMDNINSANLLDEEAIGDYLMESIPFASGYATPITLGANINLPSGISISGVYRNFNGNYYMTGYPNLKTLINNDETIVAFVGEDSLGDDSSVSEFESFVTKIPWSVDLGLSYEPKLLNEGLVKAQFSLDCIDCYDLFFNPNSENETDSLINQEFIDSLCFGAQFRFLNMVDFRAGINNNYMSIGTGFDFLILHMDASYLWNNDTNPISNDAFSLRFSVLSK